MAASALSYTKTSMGKTMSHQKLLNRRNILSGLVVLALFALAIWMRLHKLELPFDRDSYDEGVYWQSLRAMSVGQNLYQQIFYSQPPFFLLSVFPMFILLGKTLWAARMGIVLMSLFGLIGALLLGKAVSGRIGALAALLLLLMNPLYLVESQTLQAEAPAAALSFLAVGLAYLWWERPDGIAGICLAVLTAIALSLSILAKLLTISTLVPVGLLLLARGWQILHLAPENRIKGALPLIAGITAFVIISALLLLPFAGSLQVFWQSVVTFHTDAGTVLASTRSGNLAMIRHMLFSFTSLAALYGTLVALLKRDWRVIPLLAWFLVTAFLLWRQAPLFTHHLIALVPPLVALATMGIRPITGIVPLDKKNIFNTGITLIGLLLILLASILNGREIVNYYRVQQQASDAVRSQQNVVSKDLQAALQSGQLVITDTQFIAALADRDTPASLVDTSSVRISTGYVTLQQLIQQAERPQVHAILFYTGRLQKQPVTDFHTWVSQHFHLVKNYGGGKELWLK